jgi:hypothetical protein
MTDAEHTQEFDAELLRYAIETENTSQILDSIGDYEFLLLEMGDEPDDDEPTILVLSDGDDRAVAVFSTEDSALEVANALCEDERQEIPAFSLDGASIILTIPDDHGLMIDGPGEDCLLIEAPLVAEIKELLDADPAADAELDQDEG